MDADGLPLVGAGIDFSKVEAIPHKRSLACINHFVMHTVSFLNRFACVCEEKLEDLEIRIQRLETTMNILESKLSSIPGLDDVTVAKSSQSQVQTNSNTASENPTPAPVVSSANVANDGGSRGPVNGAPSAAAETPNAEASTAPTSSASSDPRYAKFFNLMKLGVPKEALAPKLLMEGLDPAVLDNPSAPVAPPPASASKSKEETDSDFSDSDKQSDSLSDSESSDEDSDD